MLEEYDFLIKEAFEEDHRKLGDITTQALIDENEVGVGIFVCENNGVLSGSSVTRRCFSLYDRSVVFRTLVDDGEQIKKGQEIAKVKGKIRSLLAVERTALNFLSHLSGIATMTKLYVDQLKGIDCRLKDTRKTTPGYRVLEKEAVKHGGGLNHREGLFDGILIKDNHLKLKDLEQAIELAKKNGLGNPIEVEVETAAQAKKAIEVGADMLLLDNMKEPLLKKAVKLAKKKVQTEASGGINLENIRNIAQTGVDFVSTSAITTGAPPLDISFDLKGSAV